MRTINVYTFDELSEEAKAKAIKNAREEGKHEDMDCVTHDAVSIIKHAAQEFNIEIYDWSIGADVQRSFVKINTGTALENEEINGLRLRTWLINHHYNLFYEKKHYGEYEKRANGKYSYDRYSEIQFIENDCPFSGTTYDMDFLDCFRAFLKKPTDQTLAHYNEEKSTSQRRRNTDFGVHFLIQREGGFFVENNTLYVLRKERYEYRYLPWKSMKEKKINLP